MDEGEKIRKLRELRGFKQSTMARALGLSTKAYSKLENGQTDMSLPRLQQIAQILGMELTDILEFDEENIYRSCRQCIYQQLSRLTDTVWLTERLQLRQRIQALEEQLAVRCQTKSKQSSATYNERIAH